MIFLWLLIISVLLLFVAIIWEMIKYGAIGQYSIAMSIIVILFSLITIINSPIEFQPNPLSSSQPSSRYLENGDEE